MHLRRNTFLAKSDNQPFWMSSVTSLFVCLFPCTLPYNFVADRFHIKKLRSKLSSSKVRFYTENSRFAFWSPLWRFRDNVRWSS